MHLDLLHTLGNELRFVMITSGARAHSAETRGADAVEFRLADDNAVWIRASASAHPKCVRCWHHADNVGHHAEHPELCGRCVQNVAGGGEARRFI